MRAGVYTLGDTERGRKRERKRKDINSLSFSLSLSYTVSAEVTYKVGLWRKKGGGKAGRDIHTEYPLYGDRYSRRHAHDIRYQLRKYV